MLHNSTPAATILDSLDDPNADISEHWFITHGDDVLDAVIGIDALIKNHWLLDRPALPYKVYDGDVAIIGSGPSLDENLDKLRTLQHDVLIVAAHSAITKLIEAGITPHLIAPKERMPDPAKIPAMLPSKTRYAGIPVVPLAPAMCEKQYWVGDCSMFHEWLGTDNQLIAASSTSGVLAMYIGTHVAKGTVWLIGHDMTLGHYGGFKFKEENHIGDILCADGERRPSTRLYRQCNDELSGVAETLEMVQCATRGARIPHAQHRPFEPRRVPVPELPYALVPRRERAYQKLRHIGIFWEGLVQRIDDAMCAEDMNTAALFGEDDKKLGQMICQALYLQPSIFRRTMGWTDEYAFRSMKVAFQHTFRGLLPWAKGVANGL